MIWIISVLGDDKKKVKCSYCRAEIHAHHHHRDLVLHANAKTEINKRVSLFQRSNFFGARSGCSFLHITRTHQYPNKDIIPVIRYCMAGKMYGLLCYTI